MNRFLLSILAIILFVSSLHAQIKVSGKATGRHAKVINQVKESKQETKARKQQAKEIKKKVKNQKKAHKLYRQRYDSIRAFQKDSLHIDALSKEDSLKISNEILSRTNFPIEYRELMLEPIAFDSISTVRLDSMVLKKGERVAENVAKEYLPDELKAEDPFSGLTDPAEDLPFKKPSKPNPNLIKPDAARELFKKVDPEQFRDAQEQIQKLKKKYSTLPDTRYPDEGTKRNALQDAPFKKRIYIGGNIALQSTDPLILNSNLQLGYWINKKWLAGVGFILREQFNNEDTTSLVTGDGHGFSLFTRCDIKKGFFAWAESEWQVNRSFFGSVEQPKPPRWQEAYLLGIGREFKIGKVQMMSMILYDFNYQNNDLNSRPLVFKLGVRFSKRPE